MFLSRFILKFISADTQKKIDQHIQSLEEQAASLSSERRALEQELADLKVQGSAAEQAFQAHQASLQTQIQSQTEKAQALQQSLNDLTQQKQALEQAHAQALAQAAEERKALAEQLQQSQQLHQQLSKAQQDAAKRLQEAQTAAQTAAEAAAQALAQATQAAKAAQAAQVANQAEHKKQLEHAQAQAAAERKTLSDQLHQVQQQLAKAQQEAAQAQQDGKASVAAAQAEHKKQVEQLQAQHGKTLSQTQAKLQDTEQENELLLLQLMQAQEELVEYYEEKIRLEKLYDAYKARWDRLEKRYPNYVDYDAIELVSFDHVSDVPSITWRVKEYAHAGVALPEFMFRVALQDGHPGIGLAPEGELAQDPAAEDSTLVPKLLATRLPQAERFMRMGNTEYRQLTAALTILTQLEASQWQGMELPADLDLAFWRPFFKQLGPQWAALPPALRYDSVKLKRELINVDYEHLWLELHGVSFDKRSWKKLEVRLGAALVQPDGFSKFPKFEIPLIDGKHKPFDSWYAESHDDAGAKVELRFSLEKNVFDAAVLAKLAEADRLLVLRLVYAMPTALQQLQTQQAAIHRPWSTWIDFARASVQVLEQSRRAAAPPVTASEARQPPPPPTQKIISIAPTPRKKKPTKKIAA